MSDSHLEVCSISKSFDIGDGRVLNAVDAVSFAVEQNSICVILGPSGCGKSTVLRIMAV